jgi:short-subunit dehydrogenase
MNERSMSRPIAAITGASSGIGAVFARKLAAQGYDLMLIARRRDRLEQLAAELRSVAAAEVIPTDLFDTGQLDALAARLAAEPRLSLLVNNAGFGTKGRFFEAPLEEQLRMHRVHMEAILRLTHAALPGMVQRNEGGVINVSSVAGFTHSAGNASYCATKAWINSFTESLYLEMRSMNSRVKVQALCPGFTYSEFHEVMNFDRNKIPGWLWTKAEDVVDASLKGFRDGKLYVVPGWPYRVLVAILPKLPVSLRLAMQAASPHQKHKLE